MIHSTSQNVRRPWFVFKGYLSMQHIQIRRLWELLGHRRLLHVRPKHRSSMLWRFCCPIRCSLFPWPTFRVDLWMSYQDILDICQRQRQRVQSCIGRQLECLIHCRRSMIQWRCMWPFCQRNQHLIAVITWFIRNRKNTHVTRPSFNPARKSLPQADFVNETKPVWAFVSFTLACWSLAKFEFSPDLLTFAFPERNL